MIFWEKLCKFKRWQPFSIENNNYFHPTLSFSSCPVIFVNLRYDKITIFMTIHDMRKLDVENDLGNLPKTLIYPNFGLMGVWKDPEMIHPKILWFHHINVDLQKLPDDMKRSIVFILWICSVLTKWTQLWFNVSVWLTTHNLSQVTQAVS